MTFEPKHGQRYNQIPAEKKAMYRTLYMTGLPITEIAKTLGGVSVRTAYHHLQPLTPQDKAEHTKNLSIRQEAQRKTKREVKND